MKLFAFLFACVLLVAFSACSKDKFKTVPTVEIKSVNHKELAVDATLAITLKFTDKEGDIGKGSFIYKIDRQNVVPLPPTIPNYDTVTLATPDFPDKSQGEYVLTLPWINVHKSDVQNDSVIFRFIAIDRAGNRSTVASSDRIVILKN